MHIHMYIHTYNSKIFLTYINYVARYRIHVLARSCRSVFPTFPEKERKEKGSGRRKNK